MAQVFVSHAGDGGEQAREVRQWLVKESHEVFLDQDRRDGIAPGQLWRQRLHERLRWADAMVCVVTSDYRQSRWCGAEVEIAWSRGIRLLPLRAEPGAADPALESVQHIDLAQDPVAARAELVAELRRVDAVGGAGWPDDRSPFPGLHPFSIEQQRVFFGRAEEIKELAKLLRSPDLRAGGATLLVVGPSGCGKSSLVRAGLAPAMADEPGWWTLRPIVPGAAPVTELARELATAAQRLGLDWTGEQVRRRLDSEGLVGLVEELLLAAPGGPCRRLLVVVDQAEELLTQTATADRARFAELVRPALDGPVQLVATLRSEFLDPLLSDPALGGMARHLFTVRPLGREGLRAVIEQPAQVAGISVDPALVDQLVDDTKTGDALPLLAFTLAQLAEGVHRDGQLSAARYARLGRVQGALIRQADAALDAAVTATGRSREEVIAGLLRLVTVDEQGRPTRWRTRGDDLPAPVATELDAFVERRLLTTDNTGNGGVIGVVHEAFLSAWPPLRDAIAASASALRAGRAVEHSAAEWRDHKCPSARLWGGGHLAAAVADTGARISSDPAPSTAPPRRGPAGWWPLRHRVLVTDRVDLNPIARKFLHTSLRRDRLRRGSVVTVLSTVLVLALIAAGVAYWQQQQANLAQRITIAQGMVAQADKIRDRDPTGALQFGVAALHFDASPHIHASLQQTLSSTSHFRTLRGHTSSVYEVAVAPVGRTLATTSVDRTVRLWDLSDRDRPHQLGQPLTSHTGAVNGVAFAPDGRTLATAGDDGTVRLWNLEDRNQPHQLGQPLTSHTGAVNGVAFASDRRTLATTGFDQTVRLWDVSDRDQPYQVGQPLTGHTGAVNGVAFAPDGRTLATTSDDETVRLWDLSDRTRPQQLSRPLIGHTGTVNGVAFAPDGRTLATTSDDGTVKLWNLNDLDRPHPLNQPPTGHTDSMHGVAFAPDGRTLAATSTDQTVRLWNLDAQDQPQLLGRPLTGHTNAVNGVAFAPDGGTLVTASIDQTVRLWDVSDRDRPQKLGQPLTDHTELVHGVAFAPDGRTLATAGFDQTVRLWNLDDRDRPQQLGQPLTGHTDPIHMVAFAPDGRTLATTSTDQTVRLWDVSNRDQPQQLGQPLTGHTNTVHGVAFAPDGRTLATTGFDQTVRLWNLDDRDRPQQLGQPLTGHTGRVQGVAFARDGRTLATTSDDQTVRLWDVSERDRPHQLGEPLKGHTNGVYGVAFAPDGRTLATTGFDQTVRLWNLDDRDRPQQLGQPLTGHTGAVIGVAFTLDGHTLATTSTDQTIRLWDLSERDRPHQLGQPLTGHSGEVIGVAFTPDGRTLATTSIDRTVRLWELPRIDRHAGREVREACLRAGGPLDKTIWDQYAPRVKYQDTCADAIEPSGRPPAS